MGESNPDSNSRKPRESTRIGPESAESRTRIANQDRSIRRRTESVPTVIRRRRDGPAGRRPSSRRIAFRLPVQVRSGRSDDRRTHRAGPLGKGGSRSRCPFATRSVNVSHRVEGWRGGGDRDGRMPAGIAVAPRSGRSERDRSGAARERPDRHRARRVVRSGPDTAPEGPEPAAGVEGRFRRVRNRPGTDARPRGLEKGRTGANRSGRKRLARKIF